MLSRANKAIGDLRHNVMNIHAVLQNSFHILEDFYCIHLKLFLLLRKGTRCIIFNDFHIFLLYKFGMCFKMAVMEITLQSQLTKIK